MQGDELGRSPDEREPSLHPREVPAVISCKCRTIGAIRRNDNIAGRRRNVANQSGLDQFGARCIVKIERVEEQCDRGRARCPTAPTFERRDPSDADAGSLGERLLSEDCGQAVTAKQHPEALHRATSLDIFPVGRTGDTEVHGSAWSLIAHITWRRGRRVPTYAVGRCAVC
jgi:hypothetical protein